MENSVRCTREMGRRTGRHELLIFLSPVVSTAAAATAERASEREEESLKSCNFLEMRENGPTIKPWIRRRCLWWKMDSSFILITKALISLLLLFPSRAFPFSFSLFFYAQGGFYVRCLRTQEIVHYVGYKLKKENEVFFFSPLLVLTHRW